MNKVRLLPTLRLKVVKNGDQLRIITAAGETYEVPCEFGDSVVREIREGLRRSLDKMKTELHRNDDEPALTVADASRALAQFRIRGVSMMTLIFGDYRGQVSEICRSSSPSWKTSSNPVVIATEGDLSRFLPLEFLPLFDLSDWPPCTDQDTLDEAVRRFPGFSAVIKREFQNVEISQDPVLQNNPKLHLKCFVEDTLPGAGLELDFFKANAHSIDFDGPWPVSELSDFPKELAGYLQRSDQTFNGVIRSPGDQIQHFVCHCYTDERVPSDSALRLSNSNTATIAELQASLDLPDHTTAPTFGPLIFLNACGTARMDPMSAASFPRFFLRDNHNRGFIGTETNIPDQFAADFSKCFYSGLLKGLSLGQAIYEAKWAMLRQAKNPLGILYTFYADPDMALSNVVDFVQGTLP